MTPLSSVKPFCGTVPQLPDAAAAAVPPDVLEPPPHAARAAASSSAVDPQSTARVDRRAPVRPSNVVIGFLPFFYTWIPARAPGGERVRVSVTTPNQAGRKETMQ